MNARAESRLINTIIRLVFAGVRDDKICQLLGIEDSTLKKYKRDPYYQQSYEQYADSQFSKLDRALAGKIEKIREEFEDAVPMAARVLKEVAQDPLADPKVRVTAASEILDRDPKGTLSKRRGSEVQTPSLSPRMVKNVAKEAEEITKPKQVVQ